MELKKAAVLFSGGKDSCLALYKSVKNGDNVKYLLSILPESYDSYMYHKPNLKLLRTQAKMLGIRLITQKSSNGKEDELDDLIKLINKVKNKVDYLIIGGIASNYQGERINKIAEKTGLKVISPLWDYSTKKLWEELLKNKFKVIITKIACDGIPKDVLGKIIDKNLFENLKDLSQKHKFDLNFEGGDAETSVLFCPLFKREIKIEGIIKSESNYRHFLVIKKVKT